MFTKDDYQAFSSRVYRRLQEGMNKYGVTYRRSDQVEFIQEKLRRIRSGQPGWKTDEDLTKVAAYAFLAWVKRRTPSRVAALSSFTGATAKKLYEEGLIGTVYYEADRSIGETYELLLTNPGVDTLFMLGWKHILPEHVIEHFKNRCFNLHPGTLPGLEGKDPHIRALVERRTGTHVTIHRVTPQVDSGEIMMQRYVPIYPMDTPETLLARLKDAGLKLARLFLQEVLE